MELKKYFILIILLNFTNFLYADTIKPANNLTAYDVIKIQLNALKNNNKPNKNSGIKQTWVFAHPKNKKITGPYERFQKMLLGDQYNVLINHESHKIKLITNSKDIKDSNAIYFSSKTTNATTIPRILSICESSKTTIHQETHTLHTENHYGRSHSCCLVCEAWPPLRPL